MKIPAYLTLVFLLLSYSTMAQNKPYIIAHRGASGQAPENTLSAFEKAIEIGVDMVELDVHLTKDGKVVVIHDEKLDRTTNMTGEIKEMTWDEMKDADAGSWYGEQFKGEKLPTLDDALKQINGRTKVLIEIKNGGDYYPGIEEKTWEVIQANNAQSWCIIQSFSQFAVEHFTELNTGLPVYKLVVGNLPLGAFHGDTKLRFGSIMKYTDFKGVNPNRKFVRKRIIKKLHARGQEIFVWTVNQEEDMKKLVEMGVDGIITNYPDRLRRVLSSEAH